MFTVGGPVGMHVVPGLWLRVYDLGLRPRLGRV